jgi:hypothetical protein
VGEDFVRGVTGARLKPDELQAEAEDHAKFVVTGTASAYLLLAMKFMPLPAGFVIPAQPVKASKPPAPIGSTKSSMTGIG